MGAPGVHVIVASTAQFLGMALLGGVLAQQLARSRLRVPKVTSGCPRVAKAQTIRAKRTKFATTLRNRNANGSLGTVCMATQAPGIHHRWAALVLIYSFSRIAMILNGVIIIAISALRKKNYLDSTGLRPNTRVGEDVDTGSLAATRAEVGPVLS